MKKSLENKSQDFKIKVTTYIQGEIKKEFVEDLNRTGLCEAQLARQIFRDHYKNKQSNNRNCY